MREGVKLTIDGQSLEVEKGTTILEAARRLGVEIPTLCHVEGLEPVSSCFLCAVEIEGRPTLAPSCGMPVANGMVVRTSTDEIQETRKLALELLLSDHAGDCIAPCRARCPAGLDIPGFVHPIATGRPERAMEVIARRLFLPGALGRICPRLCETDCRRCEHDEGLAIAALHRYAADRDLEAGIPYLPARARTSGRKVAIIGAGPAGLAAAYYLLQRGHDCTLLDAHEHPGGMLRYGIPAYRLPRPALDAEIDLVRQLGARFRVNCRWGIDFHLADLRREHHAVFIAIGAQGSRRLGCEGDALALPGLQFLERVARGERPEIGPDVIVVGGGNTAMDVSRSAVRMGARNVVVFYRRRREEMPCLMEEVEGAEEEGVRLEYLVAPRRLERNGDGSLRLTCERMRPGEPDESGRRRPIPVPGSEFSVRAHTVIAAIGQSVERDLAIQEGLDVNGRGIAVDPATLATNLAGVFAGGDAVSGADLAVRAVAAGRLGAVSIDQYLSGREITGDRELTTILMKPLDDHELAAIFRQIERSPRVRGREIDLDRRRGGFEEIEAGLTDREAMGEAGRCLSCGCLKADCCDLRQLATRHGARPYRFDGERRRFARDVSHPAIVYEPGKCIQCDACVRIAATEAEPLGLAVVGRGFNVRMAVPFDAPLSEGLTVAARKCVEACPTGALAWRTERACDACALFRECDPPARGNGDGRRP